MGKHQTNERTGDAVAEHVGEKFDPGAGHFTYIGSPEASRGAVQWVSDDDMWAFFAAIR